MSPDEDAVERRVGARLAERGETVATAESITGGLIASRLTDVPGASTYVDRGFVTYAYEAKTGTLGVDRALLDTHGAVSEPVAERMASAARDLAGTDWGVGITGIAGPTGGSKEKPVGTTYIGVAYAGAWGTHESFTVVTSHRFDGDRSTIKSAAADAALDALLTHIENRQ